MKKNMKDMRNYGTDEGNQVVCLRRYFHLKYKKPETYRGSLPFSTELLTHRTYCHTTITKPRSLARCSKQLDSCINNNTIELYIK